MIDLKSYLSGHIAQMLGLQDSFGEFCCRAGLASLVRLRIKGSEGMAQVTAVPSVLQYVHKLFIMIPVWPA